MSGWFGGEGYTSTATLNHQSQATDIAKNYVASLNNAELKVTQVEEYQNNFYVAVGEKSIGNGAFELLINKVTGIVTAEMGPNMMWNTKYTFGAGWRLRIGKSTCGRVGFMPAVLVYS